MSYNILTNSKKYFFSVFLLFTLLLPTFSFADHYYDESNDDDNYVTWGAKSKTPINEHFPKYKHIAGFQKNNLMGNATLSLGLGVGIIYKDFQVNFEVSNKNFSDNSESLNGFNMYLGLGYDLMIMTNRSVNLYIGTEIMYELLTGKSPHLSGTYSVPAQNDYLTQKGFPLVQLFGARFRIGISFANNSSKLYGIVGLVGAFASSGDVSSDTSPSTKLTYHSTTGFATIFGIGFAQDVIHEILAIFMEFEGMPFANFESSMQTDSSKFGDMDFTGMINIKIGLRLAF